MADVLLLADSPAAVDGVRRALRHATAGGACHTLRCVHGWADLSRVAGTVTAGLALVDPYHGGALAQAEIWRLRARHPALELVAYADFTGRPAGDPFTLAQLGVRAVVPRGAPDEAARLAACLDGAPGWTPLEALIERMRGLLPASVHGWLEPVLRSPLEPRTVPELARRAGCSPRTLRRTLAAAGLPSPEQLLAWRRLLHAARLLEDPGRSVESVARALDLSSGAALRKTLKAMAGLRPRDLGPGCGVRQVAACFLAACGDDEAARARHTPGRTHPRPPPAGVADR
ncbi:MAG TPA: helix-turn-helix domain-containing protein [Longimicrobium sp.]|jgi:AraC-like DNA-binding protein|uniref:helix-turn-helix transcriptional regulator n=1 Tax=Longimicrobium sp. TaxID=2029185 RepID=UPI002EDB5871